MGLWGGLLWGRSEAICGSWLAKNSHLRDRLVLATKVRFPVDVSDPNSIGLSRKHIFASVRRSLEALQTDYIDLLQMHWCVGVVISRGCRYD